MGRHSAPDDGADETAEETVDSGRAVAVDAAARPSPGRHAHPNDVAQADPEDRTVVIPVVPHPVLDRSRPEADTDQLAPVAAPVIADAFPSFVAAAAHADPITAEAHTDQLPPVVEELLVEEPVDPHPGDPANAELPPPSAPAKAPRTSASDLGLLRAHRDVLARCVAAVIVPIGVYLVVLAVIGRLEAPTVFVWCALPLVLAGVLVGWFLDQGHKRYPVSGSPDRP